MDYEKEQSEILQTIEIVLRERCSSSWSSKTWNKFKGDVIPRIVSRYLKDHLPTNYEVAGPNVYIGDNPTEFDLLVIDAGTRPYPFTSAFPLESVRRIIEVKTSGVFDIDKDVSKLRQDLESALSRMEWDKGSSRFETIIVPRCKAAYLSISERINPKKTTSIRFGDRTKEILQPFPAFFLYDMGQKELLEGEWEKFVLYIVEGL